VTPPLPGPREVHIGGSPKSTKSREAVPSLALPIKKKEKSPEEQLSKHFHFTVNHPLEEERPVTVTTRGTTRRRVPAGALASSDHPGAVLRSSNPHQMELNAEVNPSDDEDEYMVPRLQAKVACTIRIKELLDLPLANPFGSHTYKVVVSPVDDFHEAEEVGPYKATDSDEAGVENVRLPESAGCHIVTDELFLVVTVFRVDLLQDTEVGSCRIHRLDPRSEQVTAYSLTSPVGLPAGGVELVIKDVVSPDMILDEEEDLDDSRPETSDLVVPNEHENTAVLLVTRVADIPPPKGWNHSGYGVSTSLSVAAHSSDIHFLKKVVRNGVNQKPHVKKPLATTESKMGMREAEFDEDGILLACKGVLRSKDTSIHVRLEVSYLGLGMVEDESIGVTHPIVVTGEETEEIKVDLWGGPGRRLRRGSLWISSHLVHDHSCNQMLPAAPLQPAAVTAADHATKALATLDHKPIAADPANSVNFFFPLRAQQKALERQKRAVIPPKNLRNDPTVRELMAKCHSYAFQNEIMEAQVSFLNGSGQSPEDNHGPIIEPIKHWADAEHVMSTLGPNHYQVEAPFVRSSTNLDHGVSITRPLVTDHRAAVENVEKRGTFVAHDAKDLMMADLISYEDIGYVMEAARVPGRQEGRFRFTDVNPRYNIYLDVWGDAYDQWKHHHLDAHGDSELNEHKSKRLADSFRSKPVREECTMA